MMRFVTGDECGVLKETLPIPRKEKLDVTGGHVKLLTPIEQMDRSNGIVDLKWFLADGNDPHQTSSFGALLKDGRVQEFSMMTMEEALDHRNPSKPRHGTYKLVRESPKLYDSLNHGKVEAEVAIGLHRFQHNSKVCVCSSMGQISVFDLETYADYDGDDSSEQEGSSSNSSSSRDRIVHSFRAYETIVTKQQQQQQDVMVTAHASHADQGLLAVGGKEQETILFDMHVGRPIWKAKNLPPDPQTLLHPQIWPTAACFMSQDILAVGTANHQVRIYDVRLQSSSQQQQRRPVAYTPFDESLFGHRITALCSPKQQQHNEPNSCDEHLFVGDSAGFLSALDIRMLHGGAILREKAHKAVVGRYVGPSGSIRHIQVQNGRVACVGLDRMLRVFDMVSRRQIHAIYLKQRVNCLLMSFDNKPGVEDETTSSSLQPNDEDSINFDSEDEIKDYVSSSDEDEDSEAAANPFDDDDRKEPEALPSKKRRT